jgi:translation initiation factor 5A
LVDIADDGYVTLMKDNGDTRSDLIIPEGEIGEKIREDFDKGDSNVVVTVMAAVGEECIVATKIAN